MQTNIGSFFELFHGATFAAMNMLPSHDAAVALLPLLSTWSIQVGRSLPVMGGDDGGTKRNMGHFGREHCKQHRVKNVGRAKRIRL